MDKEIEQQISALQALLEAAKREPRDERLAQVMPQIMQVLTKIYQQLYQWYLGIGAPGGESPEEFNAWLAGSNQVD